MKDKKKEKLYRMTLTQRQLMLISYCVEDCHRFACGQTELWTTTSYIHNGKKIRDYLKTLEQTVTRSDQKGLHFSWNGSGCSDLIQRKFIAETYPIYREIIHFFARNEPDWNVYKSPTLTCEKGGKPPKIEEIDADEM